MSWWNTSSFGSLATQALKNAQKKIDKVLDIEDGNGNQSTSESKSDTETKAAPDKKDEASKPEEHNTWNSWLGSIADKSTTNKSESQSEMRSSWSLPSWGLSTETMSSNVQDKSSRTTSSSLSGTTVSKMSVSKTVKQSEKNKSSKRSSLPEGESVLKTTTERLKEEGTVRNTNVEVKSGTELGSTVKQIVKGVESEETLETADNEKKLESKVIHKDTIHLSGDKNINEKGISKVLDNASDNISKVLENASDNISRELDSASNHPEKQKSTDSLDEGIIGGEGAKLEMLVCQETSVSKESVLKPEVKVCSESAEVKVCSESAENMEKSLKDIDLEPCAETEHAKSPENSAERDQAVTSLPSSLEHSSELSHEHTSKVSLSSENSDICETISSSSEIVNVSHVGSKESNVSDLGQSVSDLAESAWSSDHGQLGWSTDVSWGSFSETKLTTSSEESVPSFTKQPEIDKSEPKLTTDSDEYDTNAAKQSETDQSEMTKETLDLKQEESISEIDSLETYSEKRDDTVCTTQTKSEREEFHTESAREEFSEKNVAENYSMKDDLKPEVSSDISKNDSCVSLEIIESTDITSDTEISKMEIQAQEKQIGDIDSLVKDSVCAEKSDSHITKEMQATNDGLVYKQKEITIEKESSDSDPVESYISDVVSQDLPLSPSIASSLGGTDSDNSKLDSSMDTCTSEDTVIDRGRQDEEEEGAEELNDNSASSGSPSSSFVKCMLEDAMEDGCKMEDNGSDSHSTGGEKSECSRSTGGHESGDEIDTTTSSDIEIISTPTSNGNDKVIDLSPLKIALQKTAKKGSHTHKRSDSQSSSSTQSREGHIEQLSPGRDHNLERHEGDMESHYYGDADLPPLSEETNDPYSPQKLLKKLAEMAEVLQARESKLVQLSRENNDLLETNSILRNQLQQSEEARESEMEDLNNLTSEFSERMGESEKKIQALVKEKENLKKQLQQAQEDFGKKDSSVSKVLQEKDQQIAELLQEGEKLSKQQLQTNNIIKKLRVKEKESDSLIASQKKKLEEQKTELEHLKTVLDSKEEMEKKQSEAIHQLNAAVQKQERDMAKYKSEYEDNQERIRGLQAALDNSYKEIAELNKFNAAQDSKAQETALSVEMQVREELKLMLEKEQLRHKHEKEALVMQRLWLTHCAAEHNLMLQKEQLKYKLEKEPLELQMEDLRMSMSRMEKEHSRREDMLRQEISDLQMQLQEDEARNQELTQSVTSATRPLLRQIENLQSTYTAHSTSWEKIEKNLSDRLADTQTQLANAVEKERSASEKLMELSTKITSLESQNRRIKQDKSQLMAELEIIKTKVEVLEDANNKEMAQIEAVKHQMNQDIAQLKKEKMFVDTQLDMEKTKLDQEKKKLAIAHEQITQMEREAQRNITARGTPSPVSVSRTESISSEPPVFSSLTQEELERSFFLASPSAGIAKTSLYESLRQSGAANLLENLQSQLKLREGEITQLQNEIQQLERTRESMARELVNLSNQNDELQEKVKELPDMIEKYRELDQKNNALLLMYGEKVEEANELRLDLQDVKDMYKAQIDHLLTK